MGSLHSVSYPGGFQMILPLLTGSRGAASGGTGDVETPPPFFLFCLMSSRISWTEASETSPQEEDAESSARTETVGRLQDPKTSKTRSRSLTFRPWGGFIGSPGIVSVYVSFLLELC